MRNAVLSHRYSPSACLHRINTSLSSGQLTFLLHNNNIIQNNKVSKQRTSISLSISAVLFEDKLSTDKISVDKK